MATRTGVEGTVLFPNAAALVGLPPSLHISEWSADLRRDVFDDSSFSSTSHARSKVGGMADLAGTCRAWADRDDHVLLGGMDTVIANVLGGLPSTADFELREGVISTGPETLARYTFRGIISSISIAVVKTERVAYDISFESSGAISAATT